MNGGINAVDISIQAPVPDDREMIRGAGVRVAEHDVQDARIIPFDCARVESQDNSRPRPKKAF